jgi:hypothetical protein
MDKHKLAREKKKKSSRQTSQDAATDSRGENWLSNGCHGFTDDDMESDDDGDQGDKLPSDWDSPETQKLLYAALPGLMAALHYHSNKSDSEQQRAAEMEASKKAYLALVSSRSRTEEKWDLSPGTG